MLCPGLIATWTNRKEYHKEYNMTRLAIDSDLLDVSEETPEQITQTPGEI